MGNKMTSALSKSLLITGTLTGSIYADQVILDDLIVQQSACVGANCVEDMDFGFNTVVIDNQDPSLLFSDTSNTASFPTIDWRVGVNGSNGRFYIENVNTSKSVLVVDSTGNAVALGAGSEIVNNAISVGTSSNLRRVVNVSDGTDPTDAVTLSQLNAAIMTMESGYSDQLASINNNIESLDGKINEVGAIGSAMSALIPNPRATGDNALSLGIGHYDDKTALAIGSFHYLGNKNVLVNAGLSATVGGGDSSPTALRAGMTFGF